MWTNSADGTAMQRRYTRAEAEAARGGGEDESTSDTGLHAVVCLSGVTSGEWFGSCVLAHGSKLIMNRKAHSHS
jgi:hypothetical protein